jgi:hypothetical protein
MQDTQTTPTLNASERAAMLARRPSWICRKPTPSLIEMAFRLEEAERQIKELRAEVATLKQSDKEICQ